VDQATGQVNLRKEQGHDDLKGMPAHLSCKWRFFVVQIIQGMRICKQPGRWPSDPSAPNSRRARGCWSTMYLL